MLDTSRGLCERCLSLSKIERLLSAEKASSYSDHNTFQWIKTCARPLFWGGRIVQGVCGGAGGQKHTMQQARAATPRPSKNRRGWQNPAAARRGRRPPSRPGMPGGWRRRPGCSRKPRPRPAGRPRASPPRRTATGMRPPLAAMTAKAPCPAQSTSAAAAVNQQKAAAGRTAQGSGRGGTPIAPPRAFKR